MIALRSSAPATTRVGRTAQPARTSRVVRLPVLAAQKTEQKTEEQQVQTQSDRPENLKDKPRGFHLGFTPENERFVGRAAMFGFAASLIGEVLTGRGALGQIGYEVFDDKLGILQIDALVVGLIVFNLVAAFLPGSPTYERDPETEARVGPTQDPRINVSEPKKFFGVTGFGFSKPNEIFVGRVAQLGFAASLIGETITGKGPLQQLNIETGIPLNQIDIGLGIFILFFLFTALKRGSNEAFNEPEGDNTRPRR